ncbi:hypothetical protein CTEN210_09146 [Chaetoceros tenuissimus]|uniref:Ankyrin repeat-containing domain n=1 Tax=Chaetoceros tenuissimus TaxID=426638 RepID=A0AAD3H6Y0_9STRA|nr:hypothetical protein CTEN210_09146 [Chaetoceros tenuissimus]
MSSVKRLKVAHEAGEDASSASHHDIKHIQDLPNDVFRHCLEFVGKGNFAFVAPVSKHFYWNYINLGVEMKNNVIDVDVILQQGRNKRTTAKDVAAASLRLATECFLNASIQFQVEVCRQAALNGRLDILKCASAFDEIEMKSVFPYSYNDDYDELKLTGNIIVDTIANGHLDVIEYLHDQGVDLDDLIYHVDEDLFYKMKDKKCKASSLHWMATKGIICFWKDKVFNYLLQHGEIAILKEHYANSFHLMNEFTFRNCAEGGSTEVMNWLLQVNNDCDWDSFVFAAAAKSGSIPMMELCLQNGCPPHTYICSSAMENIDKEVALTTLKWLREHNIPWDFGVCYRAAIHGNLKALKWARENGCPWSTQTYNNAAQYGNIDILDYCFQNNCPIERDRIYHFPFVDEYSAPTLRELQERSLMVYKWLHHHSIRWSNDASLAAAEAGHLATLMWAMENDCPWHEGILGYAFRSYDIPLVEYCLQRLSPIDDNIYVLAMDEMNETNERSVDNVTDAEMIEMLQKIHDHGLPWSRDIIPHAERLGRSNVASWLRCVGCPE